MIYQHIIVGKSGSWCSVAAGCGGVAEGPSALPVGWGHALGQWHVSGSSPWQEAHPRRYYKTRIL